MKRKYIKVGGSLLYTVESLLDGWCSTHIYGDKVYHKDDCGCRRCNLVKRSAPVLKQLFVVVEKWLDTDKKKKPHMHKKKSTRGVK